MKSIKDVVKCAKINSNNIATKKFKEVRKRVPEWIQNDNKLLSMKGSRCRFDGGELKPTHFELEGQVLNWIHEQLANMLCVSRT